MNSLNVRFTSLLQPFQHLITSSRRIVISAEDSKTGSRIGGNAPEGVRPEIATAAPRYLLTLALNEVSEVSLFHSIELDDETNPNYLYKDVSKLQPPESRIVQWIIHSPAPRSCSSDLRSDLIGRALVIEPERPDILVEPGGELLLGSRLIGFSIRGSVWSCNTQMVAIPNAGISTRPLTSTPSISSPRTHRRG